MVPSRLVRSGMVAVSTVAVIGFAAPAGLAAGNAAPAVPQVAGVVTVTVTPTILVSKDANGTLHTVATVFDTQTNGAGAAQNGSSQTSLLILLGAFVLLLIAAVWWTTLTMRRGGASQPRRARVVRAGERADPADEASARSVEGEAPPSRRHV